MAFKTVATFLIILCEYFVLINVVDQGTCGDVHDVIYRFKQFTMTMGAASILAFFLITVFVILRSRQPEDALIDMALSRTKPVWLWIRLSNTIVSTLVILLFAGPIGALSGVRILTQYDDARLIAQWTWVAFSLYLVALAVAHIKTQRLGVKNISIGIVYVLTVGACIGGGLASGDSRFVQNTRIVLILVACLTTMQSVFSFMYRSRSDVQSRTRGVDYIFSSLGICMYVFTALPLGGIITGNVRSLVAGSDCLSVSNVDWVTIFLSISLFVQTIVSVASHYRLIRYVISPYVILVGIYDTPSAKA